LEIPASITDWPSETRKDALLMRQETAKRSHMIIKPEGGINLFFRLSVPLREGNLTCDRGSSTLRGALRLLDLELFPPDYII